MGRPITCTDERAEQIQARADAQGRKLRQDEKAKLSGPPVMLAHPYDGDADPMGWWVSEKLDGVRAYWNGVDFISRQGNVFNAPGWFKAGLTDQPLDGELWMGRKMFQKTISVVKGDHTGELWRGVVYVVFDAPHLVTPFEDRLRDLGTLFQMSQMPPWCRLLVQTKCTGKADLFARLRLIEDVGGEGLMIREPGSLYEVGRSHTLLKVKPFKDDEATVTGHEPGKGKHKGRLGALVVQMPDGKSFRLGTGFSDAERTKPPAIGAKVTYRYTELTNDGIPKCGSFVAVRDYE